MVNERKREILRRVEGMIERLEGPLPPEEIQNGWNADARKAMLEYYRRLRADVLSGKRFWAMVEHYTVDRGFDSHGIQRRPLYEEGGAMGGLILGYLTLNPIPLLRDLLRGFRARRQSNGPSGE